MQDKLLLIMTINEYYGYKDDCFTHNSKALLQIIDNFIEYSVLCDLIGKFLYLSQGEKILNKKVYHFFYSKEEIADKDFKLDLRTYNNALRKLQEKEYITVFSDRNPKDRKKKITFFYLHREKIQEAFKEGYKLLYNKDPQSLEAKQQESTKKQNTNVSKLTTQQQAVLMKIENDYKAKLITEQIYKIRKDRILNNNNVK